MQNALHALLFRAHCDRLVVRGLATSGDPQAPAAGRAAARAGQDRPAPAIPNPAALAHAPRGASADPQSSAVGASRSPAQWQVRRASPVAWASSETSTERSRMGDAPRTFCTSALTKSAPPPPQPSPRAVDGLAPAETQQGSPRRRTAPRGPATLPDRCDHRSAASRHRPQKSARSRTAVVGRSSSTAGLSAKEAAASAPALHVPER